MEWLKYFVIEKPIENLITHKRIRDDVPRIEYWYEINPILVNGNYMGKAYSWDPKRHSRDETTYLFGERIERSYGRMYDKIKYYKHCDLICDRSEKVWHEDRNGVSSIACYFEHYRKNRVQNTSLHISIQSNHCALTKLITASEEQIDTINSCRSSPLIKSESGSVGCANMTAAIRR